MGGKMKKLLAYGTLRFNCSNHDKFLNGIPPIKCNVKVQGYKMFSIGEFPYVVPCKNSFIIGDIFNIDEEKENLLDMLEGVEIDFFSKEITEDGLLIYVGNERFMQTIGSPVEVESGDWIEFKDFKQPYYFADRHLL
jgi:gamma-glutamylcyclotransferase (GGCT)/AIG2-like uncharacterized protein YtfP